MIYCCGSIGDGRLQYGRSFHVVTIIIPTINEEYGTAKTFTSIPKRVIK
jgi:hypothetical protein